MCIILYTAQAFNSRIICEHEVMILSSGVEGLHTLVAIIVQYLFIHVIGPNNVMILASFAFQMVSLLNYCDCEKVLELIIVYYIFQTYLIVGYCIYSTDLYDIAWTTAQCILVLRLLGKRSRKDFL